MSQLSDTERAILEDLLAETLKQEALPSEEAFRARHEQHRAEIDRLIGGEKITRTARRYLLSLYGLAACDSALARTQREHCDRFLLTLRRAYRKDPERKWKLEELASLAGLEARQAAITGLFLYPWDWWGYMVEEPSTGLWTEVQIIEVVLDFEPIDWAALGGWAADKDKAEPPPCIIQLEVSGYRALDGFSARLGHLTVIIGANAAGKSSLLDVLGFLRFVAEHPLPPEIDPASVGKRLFHVGGPERLEIAFEIAHLRLVPLCYALELHGPIGQPMVARERLESPGSGAEGEPRAFAYLGFKGGRGVVQERSGTKIVSRSWNIAPNELALRRALDPELTTAARLQAFISSWHFYSGFDVSHVAALRRPARIEPQPKLAEAGGNLSAVLMWLRSEHPDSWEELETHLRSAVPDFESLGVKPYGGPGTVIGTWRERGVKGELTLADLSDGTLRFLCLATLCLMPTPPPLICIDEPETGLHPRVLPILAGLLRAASARTQVLVTTHSPYFLSHFTLDEIAVMRKDEGRAVFLRPGDHAALRREVEEIGGEALIQMHISDELEARS
ncbi:MAG TPA: AAA family ATPase [Polyangia bacterium]|nr:AAA family ATPase [Polyangia bacterium]